MNRLTSLCTTHLHSIEKTSFVMMNQQIQADNAESIYENSLWNFKMVSFFSYSIRIWSFINSISSHQRITCNELFSWYHFIKYYWTDLIFFRKAVHCMKEQNAHLGAFVHCPLGCCRQRVYYKKNKLSVMRRKLTRVKCRRKKILGN